MLRHQAFEYPHAKPIRVRSVSFPCYRTQDREEALELVSQCVCHATELPVNSGLHVCGKMLRGKRDTGPTGYFSVRERYVADRKTPMPVSPHS